VGRSRSVWEDGTDQEILRKEFPSNSGGVDLRPSVYTIEPDEAVRATAEHVLQRLGPPVPHGADELNLAGLFPLVQMRATGHFAFTNEHHAEMLLDREADLLAIVGSVRADPTRRQRRSRDTIMAYVDGRIAANDEEWVSLFAAKAQWPRTLERWREAREEKTGGR
jgi:hypothetical protein